MLRTLLQSVLSRLEKARLREHSQLRSAGIPFPFPSLTAVHSLPKWGWVLKWNFFSKCNSSCMRNLFGQMLFKIIQFFRNTTLYQKFITQQSVFHSLFYRDCTLVACWPNSVCETALFRLYSDLNYFEIIPILKIR